jgi:hypothetical protein
MTNDLDAAFASATPTNEPEPAAPEKAGGGLLPAGEYEGVVVGAEVRAGFRPWVEQELSLRLTVEGGEFNGRTTFADIELAPLTGRDGTISSGKVGYVKWQITDVLGYDGVLSELAQHTDQFIGTRLSFEQKVTPAMKINPSTGKPYENREVTLKTKLGMAAPQGGDAIDTTAFIPTAPTAEDDDIPF